MPGKNQFRKEQILRGTTTLLILRLLSDEPMHGYSLQSVISERVQREMPQGTIYVLLKSLEKRGLVKPLESQGRGEKKPYTITQSGREFLLWHLEPLQTAREIIDSIIMYIKSAKHTQS